MESESSNERQMRDVLVVEDDPEINKLVGAYVELAGFNYVGALSGGDALARVARNLPHAIVLDLMLPDISGFEVARRLKAENVTNAVPVIILTALDSDASRIEAEQHGVVEYMTKPFDPERLLEALSKHAGSER